MYYRPLLGDPYDRRLGRLIPNDWRHVTSYPLSVLSPDERPISKPVVIGVNWYDAFDNPEKDQDSGDFFIAKSGRNRLGRLRGGHSVCLEPGDGLTGDGLDSNDWYTFYDQRSEGACVGFAWSRCMSIFNYEMYAARWLWDMAKKGDEWPETNPGDNEGTSVRAAAEVLLKVGHVPWNSSYGNDIWSARSQYVPDVKYGIKAFRWTTSVDEVHAVLGNSRADRLGAVPLLNSWGDIYPHRTYLPDEVFARLIDEEGEVAVPTDR